MVLGTTACHSPPHSSGLGGFTVCFCSSLHSARQFPPWQEAKMLPNQNLIEKLWKVLQNSPTLWWDGWLSTNQFRIYFFWDQHLLASNYSLWDRHYNGFCFPRTKTRIVSPRTSQTKMGISFSQWRWVYFDCISAAGPVRWSCSLAIRISRQ